MSGAGFILAINLFVAGLFALAFFLVGFNNRADRTSYWFAIAYGFVIVYLSCEFIQPIQAYPKPIIGVVPWGAERVPALVQNAATAVVRWNTDSIVSAIRAHAL